MKSDANQNAPRGRGVAINPGNRFESLHLDDEAEIEVEADQDESDLPRLDTQFFIDHSRSIISYNNSPDVGFNASINPYRGCEHGCVYCYARPTHEYLGFSSGLDFETKIMVKPNAAQLLRKEFLSKKWQAQVLAISGNTDCYQPVERRLKITRACLEVCAEFRNPVALITKNHLVTRDIDVLARLAEFNAVRVFLSVTSLDANLARILEPRTSMPAHRLAAVRELAAAKIPVGVIIAPVIPAINDSEIPKILEAAAQAGATMASYVMLRLPHAVKQLFADWLARHFPDRKAKVIHRIEAIRGGKLYNPEFGERMKGEGIFSEQIEKLFSVAFRRHGFRKSKYDLATEHFRRPETDPENEPQLTLFK